MSQSPRSPRGRAAGFQDWVGPAATRRRDTTESFLRAFESWGYGHISTPLIEPVETVAAGVTGPQQSQLFRFMDSDGSLLALVGERTVSVARVVATQLPHGPFPLRLCYAGPVLRNQPPLGGRRREAMQAGCELIGHAGLAADAECIAVAADALMRAGVTEAQIDVGHAEFIPALLASAGLAAVDRGRVLAALRQRDLVAVESALRGTDMADAERALLLAFPTLRGGRAILDSAARGLPAGRTLAVLDELAQLWSLLEEHGITDRVHLDLGAARDWDYYTGVSFELFSNDVGFPLGSGGRYDGLLSAFGLQAPATGFVLFVDRCVDSLQSPGSTTPSPQALRISWSSASAGAAREAAIRIRGAGFTACCDLEESAAIRGDAPTIHLDAGGVATWRLLGESGRGDVDSAIRLLGEAPHG